MNVIQYDMCLKENIILKSKYKIIKIISKSKLSIVYTVKNIVTGEEQVIKEFFPSDIALRDLDNKSVINRLPSTKKQYESLKKSFLNEALIMQELIHRNIVNYLGNFEENGSVYIVMEYCSGTHFDQYLMDNQLADSPNLYDSIFNQLIDALNYIHKKGLIHRDIKPSNIIIDQEGNPHILDFGSAIYYKKAIKHRIFTTPGFSPLELYSEKSKQGIHSDIYSLTATFYYALTNNVPEDSPKRLIEDYIGNVSEYNIKVSPIMSSVIMWGLAVQPKKRCFSLKFLKIAIFLEKRLEKLHNLRKNSSI